MVSGYTATADPDTTAKALGREMPISPKFAREVAGMIRGMKVETARQALEDVIDKKRAVPLKRYNKRVSHKPGVGPGRYQHGHRHDLRLQGTRHPRAHAQGPRTCHPVEPGDRQPRDHTRGGRVKWQQRGNS